MTDIVERLRERANDKFIRDYPLMGEAADEIERLQADYIRRNNDATDRAMELERLRAYLLGIAQGTNEEWTHDWALRAIETSDLFEQPKALNCDEEN